MMTIVLAYGHGGEEVNGQAKNNSSNGKWNRPGGTNRMLDVATGAPADNQLVSTVYYYRFFSGWARC